MTLKIVGPNQTEVVNGVNTVFFSYNTPVAAHVNSLEIEPGKPYTGYIRTAKKWSVTTTRHTNKWIGPMSIEVPQEILNNL